MKVTTRDVNKLQIEIMEFVDWWVHEKRTPIPRQEIIEKMKSNKVKDFTTINALNSLIRKGYLRRFSFGLNKTAYTQLRRVNNE